MTASSSERLRADDPVGVTADAIARDLTSGVDLALTPERHLILVDAPDAPDAPDAADAADARRSDGDGADAGGKTASNAPSSSSAHIRTGDQRTPVPRAVVDLLRRAAPNGGAEIILGLATLPGRPALPPTLSFWRGVGERYLTALCQTNPNQTEAGGTEAGGTDVKLAPAATPAASSRDIRATAPSRSLAPLPAPLDDLTRMVDAAPPMRGGEYLHLETLTELWSALDELVRGEIAADPQDLAGWFNRRVPAALGWHRVGRVCFHLAENRRDPDHPFAFLATYAPRLSAGGRVQYQPLGRALEEYAGARNRAQLVNLLTPVDQASRRCGWVRELVDSGEVFHALAWSPREAHRFLRDIPQLEESGLLVRVPDWWTKRASSASRVQVGVSIGQRKPSAVGAAALLDFEVALAFDGQELTPDECARMLEGADGLVLLKGRWVEVDREKLARALAQWKELQRAHGKDGVSILHGMRLLAGAPLDGEDVALADPETAAWSDVRAGPWLEERLREIRQPDSATIAVPPAALRATLRPYQEAGVKWLWALSRLGLGACLADDMGLGKTIQVLALLLLRKQEHSAARSKRSRSPSLLVLPASLLNNWLSEIERFAPSLQVRCVHPSQTKPDELAAAKENPAAVLAGVDLVLTTYAMLPRHEWLTSVEWSLVVVDEAQAIKSPGARQTRAVKRLKGAVRIALTGTPVENRLTDLWSIFDFICPGLLGTVKTFGSFVKRLEERPSGQYAPLRRLVAPYILRRLKTDRSIIADLPDKTEVQTYCTLSTRQAALYAESVRELGEVLRESEEGIARRGVILGFIMRFKQICNHPDQWLGSGAYAPAESGKFQRLGDIAGEIASRQEKALIFTQFREIAEGLASFLGNVFGRDGLVLHGATAVGKRKALVDAFQRDGGPPFMVLSLKAGGTGLNLTAATHVIHFDRWWNPAVENQATDRAFRIGQKRNVMVHKFVCQGTIEERIDELTRDKAALAGEILEEGVPTMIAELTAMSDAELLNLVRLDIRTATEE